MNMKKQPINCTKIDIGKQAICGSSRVISKLTEIKKQSGNNSVKPEAHNNDLPLPSLAETLKMYSSLNLDASPTHMLLVRQESNQANLN